jgi:hypothetical protein
MRVVQYGLVIPLVLLTLLTLAVFWMFWRACMVAFELGFWGIFLLCVPVFGWAILILRAGGAPSRRAGRTWLRDRRRDQNAQLLAALMHPWGQRAR